MEEVFKGIVIGALLWLVIITGILAGRMIVDDLKPNCFEDEVVVWDGDSHTLCVPIEKFSRRD